MADVFSPLSFSVLRRNSPRIRPIVRQILFCFHFIFHISRGIVLAECRPEVWSLKIVLCIKLRVSLRSKGYLNYFRVKQNWTNWWRHVRGLKKKLRWKLYGSSNILLCKQDKSPRTLYRETSPFSWLVFVAIPKVFKSVLLEFPSFPVVTDMSLLYQVW